MPETKNISLEQIENYVMTGKPLRFLGQENESDFRGQAEPTLLTATHVN